MLESLVKIADSLSYPPTLSLWIAAAAILAWLCRWRRSGVLLAMLALLWSGAWSIPFASDALRAPLESRYPRHAESTLPASDAIVVLGGGSHYRWLKHSCVDPYALEGSRLAGAARAWLAGRAPYVILSGADAEVHKMAYAIGKQGVPAAALILETRSTNTRDNARNTATIARERGFDRLILATSSLHMPRAMLQFHVAGLDAIPLPIPEGARRSTWRERWFPSRRAWWRSGRAFKEYLGIAAAWAEIDASPGRNCAYRADRGAHGAGRLTRPAATCCPQPDAGAGAGISAAPRPPSTGVPMSAANASRAHAPIARGPS